MNGDDDKPSILGVRLCGICWNLGACSDHGLISCGGQNHIMAHLFEWPWPDIANEWPGWDRQHEGFLWRRPVI